MRKASLAIIGSLLGAMGFTLAPVQPLEQTPTSQTIPSAPKAPLPSRNLSMVAAIREMLDRASGGNARFHKSFNGGRRHPRVTAMVASRTKPRKRARCKAKRRSHRHG